MKVVVKVISFYGTILNAIFLGDFSIQIMHFMCNISHKVSHKQSVSGKMMGDRSTGSLGRY